jgi:hypothetical protein
MKEPSSGSLRSRWTSDAPPGKRATRIPSGDDLIADTRRPSSIKTYAVSTLRSRSGACGQIGKIISTWKLVGRCTPDGCYRSLSPVPGAPSLAQASRRADNGHSGLPGLANVPTPPGSGFAAVWDNVTNPQMEKCDWCGISFKSSARRSAHRPKLYCPIHRARANRKQAVAG